MKKQTKEEKEKERVALWNMPLSELLQKHIEKKSKYYGPEVDIGLPRLTENQVLT